MDTDAIMAMTRMENDETSPAGKSRIPNAETRAAMQEAREIMSKKQARFTDADGIMNALEEDR